MSDQYLGEIRNVGFNFAPSGWALCSGQILSIAQHTALFSLLGTYYGGNGQTTFALPNLNGAFAIGAGQGPGLTPRGLGELGGTQSVTLTVNEMPQHNHSVTAVAAPGNSGTPADRRWAQQRYGRSVQNSYAPAANTTMAPDVLGVAGGGQPHENMPPFLGVNFVIALEGIYPPRP